MYRFGIGPAVNSTKHSSGMFKCISSLLCEHVSAAAILTQTTNTNISETQQDANSQEQGRLPCSIDSAIGWTTKVEAPLRPGVANCMTTAALSLYISAHARQTKLIMGRLRCLAESKLRWSIWVCVQREATKGGQFQGKGWLKESSSSNRASLLVVSGLQILSSADEGQKLTKSPEGRRGVPRCSGEVRSSLPRVYKLGP